ncbi:aldo/keto reductase [Mucilaginibacter sp. SP1R1]|uniref:aldo/keto reductase n=1 Tax=Mucilaginibacter sp. SP1R1 TaxID=2723091 RepID=UPI00160A728E|nr:aldo/keto reductase [Mucilaginibacter sp. SP1R1]MBB6152257.1 aryl-alcohol dehydrogenase-like predicted oxidoreductase [Mucilaginibacter sp. SP1R1]
MNYRDFKGTAIAEVGLGTWQLGSADWGNINEDDAINILKTYTDAGGNFLDTADVYGMGVSETVIGKFLKAVNHPVYVATKLGRRGDAPNGWPQNFTYDAMKRQTEDSLRHLDIPRLFLEQLHCIPTTELQSGKVFDHLRSLQQQGLITHFGASVETSEEALICLEQEGLASLQIIFNLFRQHVADEVFARAAKKGVAIIVRVPLASGLLSGRFDAQTQFAANDHRNYNANGDAFNAGETFSGIEFKEGITLADKIKNLLPDNRMPQWAIRWILDHPEVTTVIPGASKMAQVNSNVEASFLPHLPEAIHKDLRELYNAEIYDKIRGHF